MIRAIIFDCFGVLYADDWIVFKSKYFGHDEGIAQAAEKLLNQSDLGIIEYDDFIGAVAKMAGISFREAFQEIENEVSNTDLLAYIKELKSNYKIGMLSNAADNWLTEMFTPEQLGLFDEIALSYEIGSAKPEHAAYKHIADKLGVELRECVFIDDQERYCRAAEDFGMKAIVFKNNEQVITELNELLTDTKS